MKLMPLDIPKRDSLLMLARKKMAYKVEKKTPFSQSVGVISNNNNNAKK